MSDFRKEYILRYLLNHGREYQLTEIAENLGISIEILEEKLIYYNTNNLLALSEEAEKWIRRTEKGIGIIGKNSLDERNEPSEAWPIDKVYCPENFITKL